MRSHLQKSEISILCSRIMIVKQIISRCAILRILLISSLFVYLSYPSYAVSNSSSEKSRKPFHIKLYILPLIYLPCYGISFIKKYYLYALYIHRLQLFWLISCSSGWYIVDVETQHRGAEAAATQIVFSSLASKESSKLALCKCLYFLLFCHDETFR